MATPQKKSQSVSAADSSKIAAVNQSKQPKPEAERQQPKEQVQVLREVDFSAAAPKQSPLQDHTVQVISPVPAPIDMVATEACDAPVDSLTAGRKIQVYCVQLKDGTWQFVAKIGASMEMFRSSTVEKTQKFYVSAKESTLVKVDKLGDAFKTLGNATKAKLEPGVQALTPYYMKIHNGCAQIIVTVGNVPIVMKIEISKMSSSMQAQMIKAFATAQSKMQPITEPIMCRVTPVWNRAAAKVDRFTITIKDKFISIKGATSSGVVRVTGKVSEILDVIKTKASKSIEEAKTSVSTLSAHLLDIVSQVYGKTNEKVRLAYCSCQNGVFEIAGQFKHQAFVLKIRMSDMMSLVHATSKQILDGSYERIQQTAKLVQSKSSQAKESFCALTDDKRAQVAAASAAGGAVVFGAGGAMAGTGVGAVLAPFTLGLSIPVGFCMGSIAGGTAGLAAGGAAGYHKERISYGVNAGLSKAQQYKTMTKASTAQLYAKVLGSTGSTFA